MFLIAAALLLQPAAEPPTDWDKEFGVEEKQRDPVTGSQAKTVQHRGAPSHRDLELFPGPARAVGLDDERLVRMRSQRADKQVVEVLEVSVRHHRASPSSTRFCASSPVVIAASRQAGEAGFSPSIIRSSIASREV